MKQRKRTRTADSSDNESQDGTSGGRGDKLASGPPMINDIDWRGVICNFLDKPTKTENTDLLIALEDANNRYFEMKEFATERLRSGEAREPNYITIHRISCEDTSSEELSLGVPWPIRNADGFTHLRGREIISNLELHLERNKWAAFIVYKDYGCCRSHTHDSLKFQPNETAEDTVPKFLVSESVSLLLPLSRALDDLWSLAIQEVPASDRPQFEPETNQFAPYLWWYRNRDSLREAIPTLSPACIPIMQCFQSYIDEYMGPEYEEVDKLLAEGKIKAKYLPYLYAKNEIQLVKQDNNDPLFYEAFKATSELQNDEDGLTRAEAAVECSDKSYWAIEGTSWSYDGCFQRDNNKWTLKCESPWELPFTIQDLPIHPLRIASPSEADQLRRRGEMFWACRVPNYVCCRNSGTSRAQSLSDTRYMIDINIYKQMHPEKQAEIPNQDDLGLSETKGTGDRPSLSLKDEFLLCLPREIQGYHMKKKVWEMLLVGRMEEVQWNDDAFKLLVIDEEKKRLIQALITNRIAADEATDLMSGKGNGLFILLHGGPGTGKTLTAESVAEVARKPLYRVTCGDIGTEPEKVEHYLETVLLLGNTWDCVVLLDEADVFLMQRSVGDFQRNALVSVFLRVLEYYDGILILTSNRVGAFDAAFKSRIQLSLHYPPLSESDRLAIWTNFIKHVEGVMATASSQEVAPTSLLGMDSAAVRGVLPELAKETLNGREIRNAVSTARQLAMFNKEPMGPQHLLKVVDEMKKFSKYANMLQGNMTDDMVARELGDR